MSHRPDDPTATASQEAAPADRFGVRHGVINLGLEVFAEALAARGVPVVHLAWRPPAGGDEQLARILDALT